MITRTVTIECPSCQGLGTIIVNNVGVTRPCKACTGKGTQSVTETETTNWKYGSTGNPVPYGVPYLIAETPYNTVTITEDWGTGGNDGI